MDGTTMESQLEERRLECLLVSSTKVLKLMRNTAVEDVMRYST
jgi:hypothetical protein